jgi:hypothetical protein
MRKGTRGSADVNARRRSISWALPCTARAIGKGTFSDWHAYREIAPASRVDGFTKADAANAALTVARASGSSQSNASRHDAYYGIAGNLRSLLRAHRAVERDERKVLSSRSWHGAVPWEQFQRIKSQFPMLKPKLHVSYPELRALTKL